MGAMMPEVCCAGKVSWTRAVAVEQPYGGDGPRSAASRASPHHRSYHGDRIYRNARCVGPKSVGAFILVLIRRSFRGCATTPRRQGLNKVESQWCRCLTLLGPLGTGLRDFFEDDPASLPPPKPFLGPVSKLLRTPEPVRSSRWRKGGKRGTGFVAEAARKPELQLSVFDTYFRVHSLKARDGPQQKMTGHIHAACRTGRQHSWLNKV